MSSATFVLLNVEDEKTWTFDALGGWFETNSLIVCVVAPLESPVLAPLLFAAKVANATETAPLPAAGAVQSKFQLRWLGFEWVAVVVKNVTSAPPLEYAP